MTKFLYLFLVLKDFAIMHAGRNSFHSPDFNVLDMIEIKGIRVRDVLGQTKLAATLQECVAMCLSLSYCLSFNVVKSKANEWLCHATRYNYTDVVLMKGLEMSNLSSHYAFNDRSMSALRTPHYSCNKLKKASPDLESGVYSIKVNNSHGVKAFCKMEFTLPSCIFAFGDGVGGDDVRQVGEYSKPEDCISRCSQKRFDGVTVDIASGTKCWCEQKISGRDRNDLYKSCKFEGEFQAYGWLEVARLNTSKHGNFNLEDAESDDISKLEQVTSGKFTLSQAGLRALYEGTNFTQIRFLCSKSHGRTIDIATQSPTVISWLLGYTSYWSQPSSCGTFVPLPGDNSRISRRCNDWHASKWGLSGMASNFNKTLWMVPFFVWDELHWEFPSISLPETRLRYFCDDKNTLDTKDEFGQTKLAATLQECVAMCLSLSYCLSFNVVKSKAKEWLCHATRYNYTDVVLMKGLEMSNLSSHYAFNDRAMSALRTPHYSCNELKKTSPDLESGVYSIKVNSSHGIKAFCKMEFTLPSCIFAFGDGVGGDDVRQVGAISNPEDCISRCSQKKFLGATVDVATGSKCWCEQKMQGRDANDLYKSCKFVGEFQAYGWLEVARLNTSKHGNFKLEDAESDDISKLEQVTSGKFALSQAGLRALYEGTNFTQIRFLCSKSHGRTIDIATQSPTVISWLLGYTSYWSQPSSCGTFVPLPGDNSRISRRCSDWHASKWGFSGFVNIFNKTMWVIPFFVWDQLHWEFPSIWFPERGLPYYCDDRHTSDTKGVWRIFVK